MDWSRIHSRELCCRIILVHEITMIVKVHFTFFIAVTGRQTWKTWSWIGKLNHISYTISYYSYTISYTILRTLQNDPLCTLDIDTISNEIRRYRLRFINFDPLCTLDIGTISKFFVDIEYDIVRQYRDIPISRSKLWCRTGYRCNIGIYRYQSFPFNIKDSVDIGYNMSQYLGWPGAPATFQPLASRWVQPPDPRPAWTVCTLAWLSWRPFLLEFSSYFLLLQWPGPGVNCRLVTVGSPSPDFKLS